MKRPDGVTILSIYHYFVAALFVLGTCCMIAIPFMVAAIPEPDAAATVPVVAIVVAVVAFILLAFAALYGVIGWGLWALKPWARLGAIVLAGLSLVAIPVGTIVGGLTLYYLFQPEARTAFGELR